ncbi:hypothetical protein [Nocardia bovistercoris]|uniref:Uncharacterized protein n=1 Tax=Nocardia bovistercoris TaxID=2785916 RepID=A0A931I8H0_9NOCA|nr:hypothetical protein [Nocardia bovistercoris]MBH0776877.1 hypothetical protein [Nocardia bovistercoris]
MVFVWIAAGAAAFGLLVVIASAVWPARRSGPTVQEIERRVARERES